jgi:L-rhamnose isomerase/sugar isomerase
VRERALIHILTCVRIAKETRSRDLAPWFADGSNYPGTANFRNRKPWLAEGRKRIQQRLLLEYKPFEPAF